MSSIQGQKDPWEGRGVLHRCYKETEGGGRGRAAAISSALKSHFLLEDFLSSFAILSPLYFFKVAFSTFWFKFGATLRRQAERSDSEARHKAPNLT